MVAAGDLAPARVVLVEERQPAVEHRGLQAVETAVGPHLEVVVAALLAVVGEAPHAGQQHGVRAGDRAAVAEAAEVLGGVEAPRREPPEVPALRPFQERALGLGRVLDQPQPLLLAQRLDAASTSNGRP